MSDTLECLCHAKINLALAVAPPLPQPHPRAGMHPIASWFAPIALADTLRIHRLNHPSQTEYRLAFPDHPIGWHIDQDLSVRAHCALEQHLCRPLPVHLELTKHIPPGTGLGGGSSDAASTLLAINLIFDLKLTPSTLAKIAASLGSDIPFFIDAVSPPRPAIVTGLGDTIERLQPVHLPIILILPPFACPTAEVYRAFDSLPQISRLDAASEIAHSGDTQRLFNDLWPAAAHIQPQLVDIHARAVTILDTHVHLSGSGSALFSITPPDRASALARALPDCTIITTHTLAKQ